MQRSIAAATTLIINFAFYSGATPAANNKILELIDTATSQVYVRQNTDNKLAVCNGDGTLLATSSLALSNATWYYINFQVTINNTTGSFYLDVDGVEWVSGTGADTQNTANATANSVKFLGAHATTDSRIDDIIIADSSGSMNNTRAEFRAAKIEARLPSGAGATTQWTPNTGANYAAVDETAGDDDTTYVHASAAATKDTYAMADMVAIAGTVVGVQTCFRARKDDLNVRTVRDVIRSNGADYNGTTQTMTTSYADYFRIVETDPDDSNPWDIAGVNAMELGVEVVA